MSHSVADAAARAVKNSERKQLQETRTPEQRIADMRKNLAARLFVTPDDQRFLLGLYDDQKSIVNVQMEAINKMKEGINQDAETIQTLQQQLAAAAIQIENLQDKLDEFRSVYEAENSSQSVTVERVMPTPGLDDQNAD